jgi:FkbM family methyltransferase
MRLLRTIGHQHWLPGRDRILRLLAHPDRQASSPFEVPFHGLAYTGDMSNFIDWTVMFYGAHAAEELELLSTLAQALRSRGKSINFFDVGANIGHHTLYMSQHADQVFAFEPFTLVRNEMARKLAHAGAKNVSIFPVALGDENQSHAFHPPTGANQGTGTLGDLLPDNASNETLMVDVVRGDDYFKSKQLPSITLLKLDVEGFELKALEGVRETLWRDRPPILMEIQNGHADGPQSPVAKSKSILEVLYPDHLLFAVGQKRNRLVLGPMMNGKTDEALVLPRELAGIIPNTPAD